MAGSQVDLRAVEPHPDRPLYSTRHVPEEAKRGSAMYILCICVYICMTALYMFYRDYSSHTLYTIVIYIINSNRYYTSYILRYTVHFILYAYLYTYTAYIQVTVDFCNFLSDKIITSQNIFQILLNPSPSTTTNAFRSLLRTNIPLLPISMINDIYIHLQNTIGNINCIPKHNIHYYIDQTLNLKNILIMKMNQLSPSDFEQILHPIFQGILIAFILL